MKYVNVFKKVIVFVFLAVTLSSAVIAAPALVQIDSTLKKQVVKQDYWSYQLQPGESLAGVCEDQVDMSLDECLLKVKKYNKLSSMDPRVGTKFNIPVDWLREVRAGVQVMSAFGEVYYKGAEDSEWKALNKKKRFYAGEALSTHKGNVLLKFHDGSEVEVSKDTELVFSVLEVGGQSTGKIQIYLHKGRINNRITKREQDSFRIETPVGVAAVRGTQFRVRIDEDDGGMFNEVLGGEVAVGLERGSESDLDKKSSLVAKDFGIKASREQGLSEQKRLLEPPVIKKNKNQNNQIRIVRLEWESLDAAESYEYELYEGRQLLIKKQTSDERLSISLLKPSRYHLLLRGLDSEGFSGKDTRIDFELVQ